MNMRRGLATAAGYNAFTLYIAAAALRHWCTALRAWNAAVVKNAGTGTGGTPPPYPSAAGLDGLVSVADIIPERMDSSGWMTWA